jgi:hypothetical protein
MWPGEPGDSRIIARDSAKIGVGSGWVKVVRGYDKYEKTTKSSETGNHILLVRPSDTYLGHSI